VEAKESFLVPRDSCLWQMVSFNATYLHAMLAGTGTLD
jgi:hypothetical protein